ncbi:Hypothetical_protein [Hexamita inflata]|uniref:Hypothetical_protein n=1 Tax=Hexamita inflata TaxID=28002 RepID=A0ABP1I0M3_9EUKA
MNQILDTFQHIENELADEKEAMMHWATLKYKILSDMEMSKDKLTGELEQQLALSQMLQKQITETIEPLDEVVQSDIRKYENENKILQQQIQRLQKMIEVSDKLYSMQLQQNVKQDIDYVFK